MLKINNSFKKTAKCLRLCRRPITNGQQNPKFYTKASEPSFQDATRSRSDTMMEMGAWAQPSTVAMVSNYPEHFYRAILGQNRETRGCISAEGRAKSVPDDCFICRSPPKQVKGTENRVLGGCFVLFHNKSIPLSLSKFNWCFLSTQTTPLTIRKAENTRQSCKVLIRPGSLPKTYLEWTAACAYLQGNLSTWSQWPLLT